jgi:solute carrier family 25 carnitine/acylcarnitine transporter 20/29
MMPLSTLGQRKRWIDLQLGVFSKDTAKDVAVTSLIAGGASGAVVCLGSAPFELVKVSSPPNHILSVQVRRQLEYQIYRDSHPEFYQAAPPNSSVHPPPNHSLPQHPAGTSASITPTHPYTPPLAPLSSASTSAAAAPRPPPFQPPTTVQAVRLIVQKAGPIGLYTGFRLHFVRDTLGTALYFAEYDVMRFWLGRKTGGEGKGKGRKSEGEQGEMPDWARGWLPKGLVPFLCGSVAGVTSWALIYPVDVSQRFRQRYSAVR